MAADEGKKEDQFSFTDQGESLGYISLEQARVVAMRTARDQPGDYGRRFSGVRMVFDVVEQQEGEDYYVVTLSLRPQGDFEGTTGQEQFFIEKEGNVAHRQVLSLPKARRGGFPVVRVGIGLVVVAVIAVGVVILTLGSPDDEGTPATATGPTSTTKTTQTIVVEPVGHKLSVAGNPVGPGQVAISIPNGTVFLSEPPNVDGIYPANLEVTFKVSPDQPGSSVVWGGVDFQNEAVSGIIMGDNRFVTVEILPPQNTVSIDDHGNTFDTASSMFLGSFAGTIDPPDDVDLFRFLAESGQRYVAEVFPEANWDTTLRLYDDHGSIMEENDQTEGSEGGAHIAWTATSTGDYFLEVSSRHQTGTMGSYTLYLEPLLDDHGNSPETATDIFLGLTPGSIEGGLDLDYFRFVAEARASYVAEVYQEDHLDPILALFDKLGNLVGENDDGEGLDGGSRLVWTTLPNPEEYFLVVGSASQDSEGGSYTLSVNFISDDHGDSLESATFISFGSTFGTIDPSSDVDFFQFYAQAGESYVFEVVLEGHPDTMLGLYHSGDIKLEENDDVEDLDGGSRIFWTAPEDGDYFLEVRSYDPDFQTGSYVIYLDLTGGPQLSLRGFYSGSITSFEDGSTGQLELALDEDRGEIVGYLTLYDPHAGSGEIGSGYFSDGFLEFNVSSIYEGTPFSCDYFAEDLIDPGSIFGYYECFRNNGTYVDNGEWSAYRQ